MCADVVAGGAQGQPQPAAPQAPRVAAEVFQKVQLTAGRSTVVPTDFDVTRMAVTNPDVADAVVVQPREILVDGKKAGTISLIVWGDGNRKQYDVVVEQPVAPLEQQLRALFPGEDVTVATSEGATILSGRVSSTNVMLRMGEIATASIPKSQLVNLLQVPGGSESQQVMLQVRFAEVNRRALTEAGLGLFLTRRPVPGRGRRRSSSPRPTFESEAGAGQGRVQRLPESVSLGSRAGHRRRAAGAPAERRLPEPGGTQPDRLQRAGSQLPGRRRVSGPGREWRRRHRFGVCSRSSGSG